MSEQTDAPVEGFIHDGAGYSPLDDAERLAELGKTYNFAKVGSARPSSLLHTYGPGAIHDLPHFTVMPLGLDDWEKIWARREKVPTIHAPRLLAQVRTWLGGQVESIRPYPRQLVRESFSRDGDDLGVPAVVFPQWLRCTGCDLLAPVTKFAYVNQHPFRPDEAHFEHTSCPGRRKPQPGSAAAGTSKRRPTAVPTRYLLTCERGHVDEFPYSEWVHRGEACAKAEVPQLRMTNHTGGKGANASVRCLTCGERRAMNEAQGAVGRAKLPPCRGRHPHLDGFDPECGRQSHLILVGASNLWFAANLSVIVMPSDSSERKQAEADALLTGLGEDRLRKYVDDLETLRDVADGKVDVEVVNPASLTDGELAELVQLALKPALTDEEQLTAQQEWDPIDLLVPEWTYLQRTPTRLHESEPLSGLTLSSAAVSNRLKPEVARVLAVEKLRKANAVIGFTRLDDIDRIADAGDRLVRLTRGKRPRWTVGTEDLGEGVFLQLDEDRVAEWEERVEDSDTWRAHMAAHHRNFQNRFSETSGITNSAERMQPARYWLLHTLAHVLIRQMAFTSGYSAASLTERIYAWQGTPERQPAAGLLITTTASDSDGTLGGLVRLSREDLLADLMQRALQRASRCSSDPVCAQRLPKDPEDFLHGAACHCCTFASETSCERANRFLDRRFLVPLPGPDLAFFGDVSP